jgi:hypothetical protein
MESALTHAFNGVHASDAAGACSCSSLGEGQRWGSTGAPGHTWHRMAVPPRQHEGASLRSSAPERVCRSGHAARGRKARRAILRASGPDVGDPEVSVRDLVDATSRIQIAAASAPA